MNELKHKFELLERRIKDMAFRAFAKVAYGIKWTNEDILQLEEYILKIQNQEVKERMLLLLEKIKTAESIEKKDAE